jgi:hypothetical protein
MSRTELEALRAEFLSRRQVSVQVITAALTVVAAVGGFALAKEDGRLEMLLVLPLVLSGLGVLLVENAQGPRRIARYIRDHLWDRLPAAERASQSAADDNRSWEHFIHHLRGTNAKSWSTFSTGATPGNKERTRSRFSCSASSHRR